MMQSNKDLKAVLIFDPALAGKVPPEEMIEYARTRKIKLVEPYLNGGDKPAIYYYRRISRSVMDRFVDVQPSDEGKAVAAFQYGLLRVDGKREDDGARINWEPSGKINTADGEIRTLTSAEMDTFSRAEQVEIGNVIWNASFLPAWIERGYPVPPSSLALWTRAGVPYVAVSLPAVAPNSSAPLAPAAAPQALTDKSNETTESKSGDRMDAIAQATT